MSNAKLPKAANFEHLRAQAKDLLRAVRRGDVGARTRFARFLSSDALGKHPSLAQAQFVLAREYGFESWPRMKTCVEAMACEPDGAEEARVANAEAPFVFQVPWHVPRIPEIRRAQIHDLEAHGSLLASVDASALEAALAEPLPLLPLREAELFPAAAYALNTRATQAPELLSDLDASEERWVLAFRQLNADAESLAEPDFPLIGVLARVMKPDRGRLVWDVGRVADAPPGVARRMALLEATSHLLVCAVHRVHLVGVVRREPYPVARASLVPSRGQGNARVAALADELRAAAAGIAKPGPYGFRPDIHLRDPISRIRDAGELADFVASRLRLPADLAGNLLDAVDVELRLRQVLEVLGGYGPYMQARGAGIDFS